MPKDKSIAPAEFQVRCSSPLSPWRRCKYPSCHDRLHSHEHRRLHEQEHRAADNALELSLEQLERHLRVLSFEDPVPCREISHRHRRPKKRVRFCSPSPPAQVSSLPEASKPLPPILIARNSESWRVVPAHERQLRTPTPPPPYSTQDMTYSEAPPCYLYDRPSILVETWELHGDQWTVVSAGAADCRN